MTSPANHARDTILAATQADAGAIGFVPADRQFPNKTPSAPAKPYSRMGPVNSDIERLSGWDGAQCDGAVHIFVGESPAIPDPESFANDAVATFRDVMDGLAFCIVDRTIVMRDREEGDVYHGIVFYRYDAVETV